MMTSQEPDNQDSPLIANRMVNSNFSLWREGPVGGNVGDFNQLVISNSPDANKIESRDIHHTSSYLYPASGSQTPSVLSPDNQHVRVITVLIFLVWSGADLFAEFQ
jgi:hypothetical protein